MVNEGALCNAVDAAFAAIGRGLTEWADPHPDRSPRDEEYSRLSDPAKWRIVGARADAWLTVLADAGLATVERNVQVEWTNSPRSNVSRSARALAHAAGAIPLIVARSQLGSVSDAGVTLGAGDPTVVVVSIPECGCDACDSGSQDVLDELDEYVLGVISGAFRRLRSGHREITVRGRDGWSASGPFRRGEVVTILTDPVGWHEVSGPSWMADR